jgi:hypothetical protein
MNWRMAESCSTEIADPAGGGDDAADRGHEILLAAATE